MGARDDPKSAFGPCPLCGKGFPRTRLNAHANSCLGPDTTEERKRIPKGMWIKGKDVVASLNKYSIPALPVKQRERNERRFEEFRLKWNASIGQRTQLTRAALVRQVLEEEEWRLKRRPKGYVAEGHGWTDASRERFAAEQSDGFAEMIREMNARQQ